jgi:Uma2 family endonuclease
MAVAIQHPASDSTAAEPSLRLFTIDELEAMVRHGIIKQDERVELIEGQVVKMSPQGTGHIWAISELIQVFARTDGVVVTVQSTLELAPISGPEPDLVVLRRSASRRQRPRPQDAVLVIEVANTSLRYDQQTKAPIYARAGVPEYWIVDLNGQCIEVRTQPSPTGYRSTRTYVRGEEISPAYSSEMAVSVDEVLGPPPGDEDDDDEPSAERPPPTPEHQVPRTDD